MPLLRDQKVTLRPIRMSDAPRFVRWLNDEDVNKMLHARPKKLTMREERKWIRTIPKQKKVNKRFSIDTAEGVHIGNVSLEISPVTRHRALFGIVIGDKKYWNKGYGRAAITLILNYGFSVLKLHRIELLVYEYNHRAYALYKKLGFKKEGVLRDHVMWKGKFYDALYMAMLNNEWKG